MIIYFRKIFFILASKFCMCMYLGFFNLIFEHLIMILLRLGPYQFTFLFIYLFFKMSIGLFPAGEHCKSLSR